jgi:hypothetical protein
MPSVLKKEEEQLSKNGGRENYKTAIALGAFALSSAQTTTHSTLVAQTFGTGFGGLRQNFLSVA